MGNKPTFYTQLPGSLIYLKRNYSQADSEISLYVDIKLIHDGIVTNIHMPGSGRKSDEMNGKCHLVAKSALSIICSKHIFRISSNNLDIRLAHLI